MINLKLERKGLMDITKKLKALEDKQQAKIVDPSVRVAMKPMLAAAKAGAPVGDGRGFWKGAKPLRKNIKLAKSTGKYRYRRGVSYAIGVSPAIFFYPWIEFGSKSGRIAANPFMRRAFEENQAGVSYATIKAIKAKMEKIAGSYT
jgi:HK97 gp10 family phage protein